jgi:periplasmic divalent cation tolerance protein
VTPVLVLTTVGPDFDAPAMAKDLITRRLVACVNIVDRVQSIYRWEGKIEDESEKILIMKTVAERVPELKTEVLARHPYEVPEFLVVPISRIEGPYRDWLVDSVLHEV